MEAGKSKWRTRRRRTICPWTWTMHRPRRGPKLQWRKSSRSRYNQHREFATVRHYVRVAWHFHKHEWHLLDVIGNTVEHPWRRQHVFADIDADIPSSMHWRHYDNDSVNNFLYACILCAMYCVVNLFYSMYNVILQCIDYSRSPSTGVGAVSVVKDQGFANTLVSRTGCSNRTWAAQRHCSIDI